MKVDSRPMLMQLAEPEYMCPKCGYKFYVYDEDKRPSKCEDCGLVFDWISNTTHYFIDETGTIHGGVLADMSKEEFERIVDKFNSIGCINVVPNDVIMKIVTTAEDDN